MGKSILPVLACILVGLTSTGCTMCGQCDLDSYGAYGGRWHRTDRDHGRVGSLFIPAGAQVPYEDNLPGDGDQQMGNQQEGGGVDEDMSSPPSQPTPLDDETAPDAATETALLDRMLNDDF